MCVIYVGEDNDFNVQAMITRLMWTIWTSLSAVRERPLNLITHLHYYFVKLANQNQFLPFILFINSLPLYIYFVATFVVLNLFSETWKNYVYIFFHLSKLTFWTYLNKELFISNMVADTLATPGARASASTLLSLIMMCLDLWNYQALISIKYWCMEISAFCHSGAWNVREKCFNFILGIVYSPCV